MKCVIIDDNKIARTALKHLVKSSGLLTLIDECAGVSEAMSVIVNEQPDLLLLDVEMPRMSGLDFLRSIPNHPLVILITARPEYAVEAFEHNVVDFLVKPVKEERFLKAILRAKEIFESNNKQLELDREYFFIREKGISTKVLINDILYIQALGDYVSIFTTGKRYTLHYTLSAMEKELPPARFMRIHRSFLVALNKIESVEEGTAFVYQNPVPIGDSQRAELLKRLNQL